LRSGSWGGFLNLRQKTYGEAGKVTRQGASLLCTIYFDCLNDYKSVGVRYEDIIMRIKFLSLKNSNKQW
jgi:hypothetical protein